MSRQRWRMIHQAAGASVFQEAAGGMDAPAGIAAVPQAATPGLPGGWYESCPELIRVLSPIHLEFCNE